MYSRILARLAKTNLNFILYHQYRHLQVTVVGAANDVGSNLSLLLMQNPKIKKLNLYDDDARVKGIGMELSFISRGVAVESFAGDNFLPSAVTLSDLILMVSRTSRTLLTGKDKLLAANAPAIERLCRVIADQNTHAFFAISTNPINSIIPLASSLLLRYGTYNPCKICGITHIDTVRCQNFVANTLKEHPYSLKVPVICGHSEETIIPLFSNLTPSNITVDTVKADTLTRLVRKAGTEVLRHKGGSESSILCMAWSIAEFADKMLDALNGHETIVNCFCANPYYGTRFFAGPAMVGPQGIFRVCGNMPMTDFETTLLNRSIPILNKEVCLGENFIDVMESAKRSR